MSANYCIDSDVLIWHLRSGDRQKAVEQHLAHLAISGSLSCSTLTVAEVEQGVRRGEEVKTRALLRSFEAHPVDRATAERAGEIVCELRSRGLTVGLADAIIAATCIVRGLTLVTYNVADFEKIPGSSSRRCRSESRSRCVGGLTRASRLALGFPSTDC
jgi:predicted nucleic acid-binding protein